MEMKILSLFIATSLLCIVQVSGYLRTYRGAVVDYSPDQSPTEMIRVEKNVVNYVKFMEVASSKKVDIIVFPENGLLTKEIYSSVPDPVDRIAPCNNTFQTTKAVKDLSCASRKYKIYSVINLLEKRKCEIDDKNCTKDYYIYNTNVVFDREGYVIARYAKYNLYDEGQTEYPENPEIVFFETDFGVRFGTFTCFDILFPTPTLKLVQQYQITNFVFTTYWFSELPFLTALQVQRGWAESNNVNLLASGVVKAKSGSGGSGIFNGKYGNLVQVLSEDEKSRLLIADIPLIENDRYIEYSERNVNGIFETSIITPKEVVQKGEAPNGFVLLKDQINLFNSEVLKTGEVFERTICSINNFCCDFYVDADSVHPHSENFTYRAVVYNGKRKFGLKFSGGIQVCGIILCNGVHLENCTSRVMNIPDLFYFKTIKIRGDFRRTNSLQMPSTLTDRGRLEPLSANKYEFKKKENEGSVNVSLELLWPVTHLHTFGIWGRDFTRDNEPDIPRSSSSLVVFPPYLIAAFMGFTLFVR